MRKALEGTVATCWGGGVRQEATPYHSLQGGPGAHTDAS